MKWSLFVTLLITIPAPIYMFVSYGYILTAAIIVMTLKGLVVAVPKFTLECSVILGVIGVHLAVLCGLLYMCAIGLTRFLYWLAPRTFATVLIILLIVVLLTVSCFDIYRFPGHHRLKPVNLKDVFREFVLRR